MRVLFVCRHFFKSGEYLCITYTHYMDNTDIRAIVKDEIKKLVNDSFDKEMAKIMHSSNSKTRDELISTIKNAMESVYKMLWVKKDFWKSDIK